MNRRSRMLAALQAHFSPGRLEIHDDSAKHHGHAGAHPQGQTHYTLVIEAEAFRGMSRVQAHRAVFEVLQPEFDTGLHALAITARAPR